MWVARTQVAHLGRPNPVRDLGLRGLGRATQVRNPGAQSGLREPKSHDPRDLFLSLSYLTISLSLIWSLSL